MVTLGCGGLLLSLNILRFETLVAASHRVLDDVLFWFLLWGFNGGTDCRGLDYLRVDQTLGLSVGIVQEVSVELPQADCDQGDESEGQNTHQKIIQLNFLFSFFLDVLCVCLPFFWG